MVEPPKTTEPKLWVKILAGIFLAPLFAVIFIGLVTFAVKFIELCWNWVH